MKTIHYLGVALVALAQGSAAQSLESRIASARGTVGFEFTSRDNVCGNGSSIFISDDTSPGWTTRSRRSGMTMGHSSGRSDRSVCRVGPVRVVLSHAGGSVTDLSASVGGVTERADTELGDVTAAAASRYLLSIAPRLSSRSADNAIMAAAIGDAPIDWKRMLAIARDNDASPSSRKSTIFWVSQEAGTVATAGLTDIALDDDADASVKSDALFHLAQRKDGEGVPALIRVVRESKSAKLKKDAIWHLSQTRDPRALDLFEKLLAGK